MVNKMKKMQMTVVIYIVYEPEIKKKYKIKNVISSLRQLISAFSFNKYFLGSVEVIGI